MTQHTRRDFARLLAVTPAVMLPRAGTEFPSQGEFDVKRDFGAVGDGTRADDSAFTRCDAASRAAGAAGHVPRGKYLISSSLSLHAFTFDRGATIRPAAGVTITFTNEIGAGAWQVFDIGLGGRIVVANASEVDEAWWGGPAGGGGDDSPFLQAAVDSFDGRRGTLRLARESYRLESSHLDLKRVNLAGASVPANGAGGGTVIRCTPPYGLRSSIEDNFGFAVSDLRVRGTDQEGRRRNGQILIDFTGQNYPRASNIRVGYAEIGIRLDAGKEIECHYGVFHNVQFDKCHTGVSIDVAHSQKFFGGRFWDCVVGVSNRSSNDIALIGCEFESDHPIHHPSDGRQDPETTLVCCRDESRTPSRIEAGDLNIIGGGWSGYARPAEFVVRDGEISSRSIRTVALRQDNQPVRPNYLRNPGLQLSAGDENRVPGWDFTTGSAVAEVHSPFGRALRVTRGSSTACNFTQRGIRLREGTYHCGIGIARDAAQEGSFTAELVLLNGDSELRRVTIPQGYYGGIYRTSFRLDGNSDQVAIRLELTNFGRRAAYVYAPYICKGPNAERYSLGRAEANPFEEMWSSAPPATGVWSVGDKVWNTEPEPGGFVGWVYTRGGWKGFGTIQR